MMIAAVLVACGPKRKDCDALMGLLNEGITELENSRQQQKNDPTKMVELRKLADLMENLARRADELGISTPEVKALAQRYAVMGRDVAKSAREVADAQEKNDVSGVAAARTKLNEVLNREDPIVDELNKFCSQ
ncbi:MAG: hypothetical protein HOW73_05720 [Polyangiaceae bacterium]|nr:hypothetical protein [Polyangiaceae bacterium]